MRYGSGHSGHGSRFLRCHLSLDSSDESFVRSQYGLAHGCNCTTWCFAKNASVSYEFSRTMMMNDHCTKIRQKSCRRYDSTSLSLFVRLWLWSPVLFRNFGCYSDSDNIAKSFLKITSPPTCLSSNVIVSRSTFKITSTSTIRVFLDRLDWTY